MAQEGKPPPSATPPQAPLLDRLARAIEDEESRRPLSIRMTVRGGLTSQRYELEFTATGDGAATCRLADQLRKRTADNNLARTTLGDKGFVDLLKKLRPALEQPTELPSFLPDTLVGILEVSDGSASRRIYFAADPEQARTQGRVPPAEVKRAIDAVYAACASLTGIRNIRP